MRLWEIGTINVNSYLSIGKGEIHIDRRFHVNRFTVQVIGLVTPLLHRLESGLCQHWGSTDDLQILNRAILADYRLKNHRSLDARLARKRRIGWSYIVN